MFRKKTIRTTHQVGVMPIILVSLLIRCGVGDAAEPSPPTQYAIEQSSQPVAGHRERAHDEMSK